MEKQGLTMKRSSMGANAIAAGLSLSRASVQPRQDALSLDLICPMTATVSPQDRNPPLSAEITGEMRDGLIAWLEVVYTLLNGRKVRRGGQYVKTRIWTDRANGSIMWSGTYARETGSGRSRMLRRTKSRVAALSFLSAAPFISGPVGPKARFIRSTPDSPAKLGSLLRTLTSTSLRRGRRPCRTPRGRTWASPSS